MRTGNLNTTRNKLLVKKLYELTPYPACCNLYSSVIRRFYLQKLRLMSAIARNPFYSLRDSPEHCKPHPLPTLKIYPF